MPDVPAWLTIVLSALTGLAGNLAKPMFDFRASRETIKASAAAKQAENAVAAAEKLRDSMLEYVAEVRVENAGIRQRLDYLEDYNARLIANHSDFRTFVLTEAGHAQFHNDRKEHEQVAKHLDNLIGGAKRLQLPLGGRNVPTEPNGG